MPYIKPEDRRILSLSVQPNSIRHAGELNYLITRICLVYLAEKNLSYQTLNEIVGVLECAKLEMYRRMAAPYEDQKIAENGDVYPMGGN